MSITEIVTEKDDRAILSTFNDKKNTNNTYATKTYANNATSYGKMRDSFIFALSDMTSKDFTEQLQDIFKLKVRFLPEPDSYRTANNQIQRKSTDAIQDIVFTNGKIVTIVMNKELNSIRIILDNDSQISVDDIIFADKTGEFPSTIYNKHNPEGNDKKKKSKKLKEFITELFKGNHFETRKGFKVDTKYNIEKITKTGEKLIITFKSEGKNETSGVFGYFQKSKRIQVEIPLNSPTKHVLNSYVTNPPVKGGYRQSKRNKKTKSRKTHKTRRM
jgi:hypothetical protein